MEHSLGLLWHGLIDLVHLWIKWGEHELEKETLLWGHHLFFWARIGKGLEFAAALVIVADILGPEKLRSYGKWLSMHSLAKFVKSIPDRSQNKLHVVYFVISAIVFVCLLIHGDNADHPFRQLPIYKIILHIFLIIIAGAVLGVLSLLALFSNLAALAVLLDFFATKTAWVLEKPNGDKWIKTVSLLLLVTGFHFDLLAS